MSFRVGVVASARARGVVVQWHRRPAERRREQLGAEERRCVLVAGSRYRGDLKRVRLRVVDSIIGDSSHGVVRK